MNNYYKILLRILITGSSGFIGFSLAKKLLNMGISIVGVDNQNNYYDPKLKEARKLILNKFKNFKHITSDLSDTESIKDIFKTFKPKIVVNLAAKLV